MADIYTETKDRAKFFQTIQAWPLANKLDYEGWLGNFSGDNEKEIACHILEFFVHYPSPMVDHMLKCSVSNAGHIFASNFHDWTHENFRDRCIYSFIPGERPSPTDSGNLFTRKLRDELEIPEHQIVDFSLLPQKLLDSKIPIPVVLVDDFVGSGAQVDKAWNKNKTAGVPIKQIANMGNHCIVYAPLVVNYIGHQRISDKCSGLHLSAAHILGPEYNLFSDKCPCWKNDLKLYSRGVSLILQKSAELGIPSTNGRDTRDEKGFGMQGLALSFEHGAPDAIPSIFYWKTKSWSPLIRKVYKR